MQMPLHNVLLYITHAHNAYTHTRERESNLLSISLELEVRLDVYHVESRAADIDRLRTSCRLQIYSYSYTVVLYDTSG